nr:FAD-binding oxidoreductase [Pseudoxanthomonas sp.]
MPTETERQRRRLLRAMALGSAAAAVGCRPGKDTESVGDVSDIDHVPVAGQIHPGSTAALQQALRQTRGPLSIEGARYSMGGQIAADGSTHIDMRGMKRLLRLDTEARTARVQAGMCWRDLQDHLDPHDLAVRVMQSYSNFSIGGSLSVNCHGRYVGAGPVAHSVRALQLVTADGGVHELDHQHSPELFAAVLGGYGGLGVVTEVELDLDANFPIRRDAQRVALDEYPDFFRDAVHARPGILLHNADLMPPDFDRPLAISWTRTEQPLTLTERLVPRDLDYGREQNLIWSASELPGGGSLREKFQTERILAEPVVAMRNREASLDAASLEPRTRMFSTYLLQEYFIPVKSFATFARRMTAILRQHEVNALNVSIRHSPADTVSLLKWAPQEVFSFVLYHKQRAWSGVDRKAGPWTRQLIDTALALGGRYYLPYRLHATPEQFHHAYPEATAFAAIKRQVDPQRRFRNRLWDKYLPA